MSQYLYSVVIVTVLILNNVTIFEKHCMKGTNKPMSQQPICSALQNSESGEDVLTPDNMTITLYDSFWNPPMDLHVLEDHRIIWQTVNVTLLPSTKGVKLSGEPCTELYSPVHSRRRFPARAVHLGGSQIDVKCSPLKISCVTEVFGQFLGFESSPPIFLLSCCLFLLHSHCSDSSLLHVRNILES